MKLKSNIFKDNRNFTLMDNNFLKFFLSLPLLITNELNVKTDITVRNETTFSYFFIISS
jgi:hypothetical protein